MCCADHVLQAAGLPGCTVSPAGFTPCWISYQDGCIAVGTGPVGSSLSFMWQDPEPAIPGIKHVGLSCWDTHVSYRDVQLLPALSAAQLAQLQREQAVRQQQQQQLDQQQAVLQLQQQAGQLEGGGGSQSSSAATAHEAHARTAGVPAVGQAHTPFGNQQDDTQQHQHQCKHQQQLPAAGGAAVPALLQLVQDAILAQLHPAAVCHVLQLAEALLPRTQHLFEACVQLAGEWFKVLVQQHLQEVAQLPLDVLIDVLHEPLLVSALDVGAGLRAVSWHAGLPVCCCAFLLACTWKRGTLAGAQLSLRRLSMDSLQPAQCTESRAVRSNTPVMHDTGS